MTGQQSSHHFLALGLMLFCDGADPGHCVNYTVSSVVHNTE